MQTVIMCLIALVIIIVYERVLVRVGGVFAGQEPSYIT